MTPEQSVQNLRTVMNALIDDYIAAKEQGRIQEGQRAAIGVIDYWAFKVEVVDSRHPK